MVRLKHERSGVIIDVAEEMVGRLSGYEPVRPPAAPKRASKSAPKKDTTEK